jgi:hypothetical protein
MRGRLAIADAYVRSTLECGGSTPPWHNARDEDQRRRRAAALQGASHSYIHESSRKYGADMFCRYGLHTLNAASAFTLYHLHFKPLNFDF